MQQFLIAVEIPVTNAISSSPSYPHEWLEFERAANTILKPVKACKRHQQNVWTLPVENGLPVLLALSSMAEKHNLPYSVLLLDNATDLSAKKAGYVGTLPTTGL